MQQKSDAQLLRDYAERGTESAFAELVQRHTNLVYSAALRQVKSSDVAAEIAQGVFIGLMRSAQTLAPKLAPEASLAGWLCRSARNLSLNHRRDEFRRFTRERHAMEQFLASSDAAPDWEKLRLVLDEAMAELDETDYDALVLRFFQNQDFRSVGRAIGVSDDTAQKRASRALDKLRALLAQRGICTAAAALSGAITANAVQCVPAGLAASISAGALTAAAPASPALIPATKTIAMTTVQKLLVTAALTAAVGAGIYQARQAAKARAEVQKLQAQQASFTEAIQQLRGRLLDTTNRLAVLMAENTRLEANPPAREVLKLRGDVTRLRNDSQELSQLKSNRAAAENELFDLSMARLKQTMTNDAVERVEKMKSRLGLSEAQAEAIRSALFAKAESTVQIYKGGNSGHLSGKEQQDQFQKLNADVDQALVGVLSQSQLVAYEAMNNDAATAFAKSWGESETAYIDRVCKLSTEQKDAAAKVIAGLSADEGGPGSLALGPSATDARQRLEARAQALETILTPEQLETYRRARLQEIEMYEAGMRVFSALAPTNR